MESDRTMRICFLTLGTLFLVEFAVVMQFQASLTGIASLVFGLFFYANALKAIRGADDTDWSRSFVYAFVIFTLGVAVWVIAQLLDKYVLG